MFSVLKGLMAFGFRDMAFFSPRESNNSTNAIEERGGKPVAQREGRLVIPDDGR